MDVGHWMSASRLKLNTDDTKLLWAGSHHTLALLGSSGPSLQLGSETITASDQVCMLGVTLSDLSPQVHVSSTCNTRFYWFRQLRRARCSLSAVSAATLSGTHTAINVTTVDATISVGRIVCLEHI